MVYSKTLNLDNILNTLPEGSGFLVAYSGGSDSTALLHLFSKANNVRAIHVNHGIHKEADQWQQHCQLTCEKLNVRLLTEKFKLIDTSENTCRKARYQAFKKHLKPNEILLTAHHADDQAETILLKLLRGTGINGITGMEKLTTFQQGYLARVLLDYSALDLKEYLSSHNLNWIEDDSNANNNYRRNYIRNEIVPSLEKHWPNAIDAICRTGENIHNSELLLNHYIHFKSKHLTIEKILALPQALQSTLFYHWLSSKNLPVPDKKAIEQICSDFTQSDGDKNPHYKNGFYQLMRWKQAIYCLKNYALIDPELEFKWDTGCHFELPNKTGTLHYSGKETIGLVIKFNQTGQKLKPIGSKISKTVKNLFQENLIPTWLKQNTPYVYKEGQLISLGFSWSATCETASQIQLDFEDLTI